MKLEYFLIPYTIINPEWIKYLNVRPDPIKLLGENIGRTLCDINLSKILHYLPKVMEIEKIKKWDPIKYKILCTAKETINKMKRQPPEWQKIITNKASDKGLIFKIYKWLLHFNITKTTQSKNWQNYTDISPKRIYSLPTNTWKDVQFCSLLEICKSKLQ